MQALRSGPHQIPMQSRQTVINYLFVKLIQEQATFFPSGSYSVTYAVYANINLIVPILRAIFLILHQLLEFFKDMQVLGCEFAILSRIIVYALLVHHRFVDFTATMLYFLIYFINFSLQSFECFFYSFYIYLLSISAFPGGFFVSFSSISVAFTYIRLILTAVFDDNLIRFYFL